MRLDSDELSRNKPLKLNAAWLTLSQGGDSVSLA
jgi:hypothetical protein